MAESALTLGFTELELEVGRYLGYDATVGNWSAAEVAEVERYIQSGVRQFYYPPAIEGVEPAYEWSFLKLTTTISTAASDAVQDLPDLLGRVVGDFHFAPNVYLKTVPVVSEAYLQLMLQKSTDEGRPQVAAIRHTHSDLSGGQRMEVAWWPIPDAVYVMTYRYEAYSGKLVKTSNENALGGMKHSETILASCLSVAELRANDERGPHWDNFTRLLAVSISQDRKASARNYGYLGGESETALPRHGWQDSYDITYKATTW
jgi:hypothetical protein